MGHSHCKHNGKELERSTGGKLDPLLSLLRASWQLRHWMTQGPAEIAPLASSWSVFRVFLTKAFEMGSHSLLQESIFDTLLS